jgi:hypothetical protein
VISTGFARGLLVVGVLIIAWGANSWWSTSRFAARALSAPGEVIELKVHHDSEDNSNTYSPVFRYTLPNGRQITLESGVRTYPPAYQVGERVQVLYEPDDPAEAKISGFWSLWGPAVALGVLGLLVTTLGGWFARSRSAS